MGLENSFPHDKALLCSQDFFIYIIFMRVHDVYFVVKMISVLVKSRVKGKNETLHLYFPFTAPGVSNLLYEINQEMCR